MNIAIIKHCQVKHITISFFGLLLVTAITAQKNDPSLKIKIMNDYELIKQAIAVIFEVIPAEGYKDEYLNIALSLKPRLEKIKGFISIERFQSINHPEKILSLSFWENEEAIQTWRREEIHRNAQSKGREYIFKDYRLRIAQVVRDYGMFNRKEAPTDSKSYHK